MSTSPYTGTQTPLAYRLIAAFGSISLVTGLGALLAMKSEPPLVQVNQDTAVFVSLIEEPVAEAPKGEQTDSLPPPAEEPPAPEPESEPEAEPESEPEPEPPPPEPAPVVEPPPKPKPKPKPKPELKKVEQKKPKTVDKPVAPPPGSKTDPNSTATKPFGIPTGKPNAPIGGGSNLAPVRVTTVNYVVKPKPVMPRSSQMRGEKGLVIIRVVITTTGTVKTASIQKASPYDALNQEALRAVQRARFRPYAENGVPRESMADIPINFK